VLRIKQLRRGDPFPPVEQADDEIGGLLAYGGDLLPERLLDAYSRGIFPWYSQGDPILWWSPDPRMVLTVSDFHVSHSLARRRRTGGFEVRVDTAFERVIAACATVPRGGQNGTWITPEMLDAYVRLHTLGYAHSVETWRDGALVGGLYGIGIDRMFFGESMFARESDASKVALAHLIDMMRAADMPRIDCQQQTRHLASLGARPEPRASFTAHLRELIRGIRPWPVRDSAS
jgi:leucyl/phenylalanyl-tRNA--protein transferase